MLQVLERLTVLYYQLMTLTTEMARLAAGNLLGELLNNVENKMQDEDEENENQSSPQKAFFYSAHDSTIMALFGAFCAFCPRGWDGVRIENEMNDSDREKGRER